MSTLHTPVLIVGGGVAGLSSAVFLGWHGVPCVLVERHPDLLIHPRARGLSVRTMEVYRQVGLEPAIHAAAYAGTDFVWTPVRAETLNDAQYHAPDEPQEDDGSGSSPSSLGPIDQDKLEVLLRDEARKLGADIWFHTELLSHEQDSGGVTTTVRDRGTGAELTVQADYLIAADGVHSPIRQRLGIGLTGPGPLHNTITAMIDADLNAALRGRPLTIAYLQRPQPFTVLLAHNGQGTRWVFATGYDPQREGPEDFTDARVVEMVRAAAGLPEADVTLRPQIPGTDLTVLAFPIVAQIAESYRAGRVFLVGDAAHAWPPTGGLGANAGIQDAHNLAWKLAAVLRGAAASALLDTYHDERRPTGLLTMTQAMARFGTRMAPGEGPPGMDPEVVDYGAVALGYQYRSSAVLGADDDPRPVLPRELSGQPGTRAPHVEVTVRGAPMSTLDLYGKSFVLLAGADGQAWVSAAARQAHAVDTYRFGADLIPVDASAAHGIGASGALLVRPDGFVAWRATGIPTDLATDLDHALRTLMRPPFVPGVPGEPGGPRLGR